MVQLLYIVASLHVLICPFTKVEESFNIQAFHDILYHRLNVSEYDHNEFPGVVPRTFIGPLVISLLCSPVAWIFHLFDINKFWMQYVVRLTLALTVIAAWNRLRNALKKQFGNTFAWWFTLVSVTQYHFMFYMSRPLPNIMALPLVLLALEGWLLGKHRQFITSAGAAIIIFRSELAMLFGLYLILDLYFKKIDVISLIKTVLPVGIALVSLTVIIDSIFWGRLIWPEAEVFWFNTILNKSSNWGTSPFLWYFYSALPRGLGPSIVLLPVGLYLEKRLVPIVLPALIYILLFSFLPHKELRFIIYVFPLLNISSAAVCSYIAPRMKAIDDETFNDCVTSGFIGYFNSMLATPHSTKAFRILRLVEIGIEKRFIRRTKSPIYELLFWGTVMIIVCNIIFSLALAMVAMTNYPGGIAITRFHKIMKNEPYVHVHISNLAAQTGVTRFTQVNDYWIYSKNESLQVDKLQEFTHLLYEAKSKYSSNLKAFSQTHVILDSIESFSQITVTYKLLPPIKIKTKPAVFILERKNFRNDAYSIKVQKDVTYIEDVKLDQMDVEEKEVDSTNISEEVLDNPPEQISVEVDYTSTTDGSGEIINKIVETTPEENSITIVDDGHDDNSDNIMKEEPEKVPVKSVKMKKALDEVKTYNRQERKKKAISKIKSETRKEVVASAKEKLKEIMKRHKHIADELSETNISDKFTEVKEVDGRGDIPDIDFTQDIPEIKETETDTKSSENIVEIYEAINHTNVNVDTIVEEVIVRLLDRKIYDDKTKPEDIKVEDRMIIQKIVEEVLFEKMNFTKTENKTY